jgi:SAM-dependent methyltransferase
MHDNPTSQCGEAGEQEQIYVIREDSRTPARTDPAERVRAFYDRHPYPAPLTNLDRYIELYRNPDRHRALALLFWPTERPRADREILVAGCGTSQAARHALREPGARVTAIDISETSLHHLADPDAGLRALRDVLAPDGAMHLMVYATYGRAGIYMMQEYCRPLGLSASEMELRDLGAVIRALSPDHPIAGLSELCIRDRVPHGSVAVLINRAHTYPDLALPITAGQERVFAAIDGKHSIDEILRGAAGAMSDEQARGFIRQLWEYDQIVLDATGSYGVSAAGEPGE